MKLLTRANLDNWVSAQVAAKVHLVAPVIQAGQPVMAPVHASGRETKALAEVGRAFRRPGEAKVRLALPNGRDRVCGTDTYSERTAKARKSTSGLDSLMALNHGLKSLVSRGAPATPSSSCPVTTTMGTEGAASIVRVTVLIPCSSVSDMSSKTTSVPGTLRTSSASCSRVTRRR